MNTDDNKRRRKQVCSFSLHLTVFIPCSFFIVFRLTPTKEEYLEPKYFTQNSVKKKLIVLIIICITKAFVEESWEQQHDGSCLLHQTVAFIIFVSECPRWENVLRVFVTPHTNNNGFRRTEPISWTFSLPCSGPKGHLSRCLTGSRAPSRSANWGLVKASCHGGDSQLWGYF